MSGDHSDATAERFVPAQHGALMTHEHTHRYALAASLLGGSRVLDLGSGSGYGAQMLRAAGARVVGLDLDLGAARAAAPAVRASAEQLPFADASFDAVVCFEMIEHVPHPERVVDEIARVLGRSGIALISTPDRVLYTERAGNRNPFHLREMTRPEFATLLGPRFPAIALYGQSVWSGSWLSRLDENGEPAGARARRVGVVALAPNASAPRAPWVDPASEAFPTPLYLVALCARSAASLARLEKRVGADQVLHDREQRLIGEHFELVESIGRRDRELESHEVHARNVEALAQRAEARVAALEKHIANLEDGAAESALRIQELEQHARNLQVLAARREEEVASRGVHTANLERLVAERTSRIAALEEHVANLETLLAERRMRVHGLEEHVENLEAIAAERTAHIGNLEAHVRHLEAIGVERNARAADLARHAANLEARFEERSARVRELEARVEALAAALREAGERQSESEREIAAARAQLMDLRASRWVRLGQWLHRVE